MLQSVANRVRQFHNDDRGTVSLESIAVFAVGALVLGGVMYLWKNTEINGQKGMSGVLNFTIGKIFGMDFFGGGTGSSNS
jgi:hypothetical protein